MIKLGSVINYMYFEPEMLMLWPLEQTRLLTAIVKFSCFNLSISFRFWPWFLRKWTQLWNGQFLINLGLPDHGIIGWNCIFLKTVQMVKSVTINFYQAKTWLIVLKDNKKQTKHKLNNTDFIHWNRDSKQHI